jgi:hypothetical protein
MVAKVRERLQVSKLKAWKLDTERLNLRKLNELYLGNSIRLRFKTGLQL